MLNIGLEDKKLKLERCELKKLNIFYQDIKVIKRNNLFKIILEDIMTSPNVFTKKEIDQLYKVSRICIYG